MSRIPAAERRGALLQAALRVIAEGGVAAATTRAIVAEAGMSLASFHYVFRSRDEAMGELMALVLEGETTAAFASLRPGADIRSSLRTGLQSYFDLVVADPTHEQVVFELTHHALRTPGLEHLAREQYERYRAAVGALLAAAADAAGVAWSLPVADVARIVVTFTDGVTLAWLADRDSAAAHRVLDLAADTVAALATPTPTRESGR